MILSSLHDITLPQYPEMFTPIILPDILYQPLHISSRSYTSEYTRFWYHSKYTSRTVIFSSVKWKISSLTFMWNHLCRCFDLSNINWHRLETLPLSPHFAYSFQLTGRPHFLSMYWIVFQLHHQSFHDWCYWQMVLDSTSAYCIITLSPTLLKPEMVERFAFPVFFGQWVGLEYSWAELHT